VLAQLVFDGDKVQLPESFRGKVRDDQFQGTEAEKLMEVCGRTCYDSFGSGRPSAEYHKNLIFEQKHYSVPEHVHFTIEVDGLQGVFLFLGIPDLSVVALGPFSNRITLNLRHVLEWPDNVTFDGNFSNLEQMKTGWGQVLRAAAHRLCPNVIDWPMGSPHPFKLCQPERDTEAFVSLFLEDSRVWSHEMVRHRGNMSQRSGRFVDETDRRWCIHPLFRDYLNEVGFLKNEDWPAELHEQPEPKARADKGTGDEAIFEGARPGLSQHDIIDRTRVGSAVGGLLAQSKLIYLNVVDRLNAWLILKGMDPRTARKQARSAGRYYLPHALSTEMVFTASIRHWRHIFKQRVTSHADAAIRELMENAVPLVKGSRYGHLL
jgi:thymidylate synthase ThyX